MTTACMILLFFKCISTHILTKRMTYSLFRKSYGSVISTHILTKRMTTRCRVVCPVKIFQLTSSRRGWQHHLLPQTVNTYFNSHPHEEDDYLRVWSTIVENHFNSHPHEEDDQFPLSFLLCFSHFNSHPHEEDDLPERIFYNPGSNFNSHPHEEDDISPTSFLSAG